MKWIWILIGLWILGLGAGMVEAVSITSEVNVSGMTLKTNVDGDLVSFVINDSKLILSPVDDCWGEVSGSGYIGGGFDGSPCTASNTANYQIIYVGSYIEGHSNISFFNQTGNLTWRDINYNTTGGGFINLTNLDNLSGECYYGTDDGKVVGFQIPFNASLQLNKCYVTYYLNSSSENNVSLITTQDTSIRALALATAVGGLALIILYKAKKWDSVS